MKDLEIANLVLQKAIDKMGSDLSKLIGEEIGCAAGEGITVSPEEFSAQFKGKLVLCNFEINGDFTGEAFLVAAAKPAILLGGKLIMLPASELETRVKADNFDGELADAFEEISNIITGALNSEFINGVPKKLHFKKTNIKLESSPFIPTGVIPGLSLAKYHLTAVDIAAGSEKLGAFWFLLPPESLNLDQEEATEAEDQAQEATSAITATSAEPGRQERSQLVLVVADEPEECEKIATMLAGKGIVVVQAGVQEDLRSVLNGQDPTIALLIMREVGEQSFAAAIKLRAVIKPATPLIAAGPAWTKKAVLQAVKYGACDILITPVAPDELLEKLQAYRTSKQ